MFAGIMFAGILLKICFKNIIAQAKPATEATRLPMEEVHCLAIIFTEILNLSKSLITSGWLYLRDFGSVCLITIISSTGLYFLLPSVHPTSSV